jgi:hypothetical protein
MKNIKKSTFLMLFAAGFAAEVCAAPGDNKTTEERKRNENTAPPAMSLEASTLDNYVEAHPTSVTREEVQIDTTRSRPSVNEQERSAFEGLEAEKHSVDMRPFDFNISPKWNVPPNFLWGSQ